MKDHTRRTVRTFVWVVIALAAALPTMLPTLGISTTGKTAGIVLTVATTITRVASSPRLQPYLPKWLRADTLPREER